MSYKKLNYIPPDIIIKTMLYWFKTYREKKRGGGL